LGIRNNRQRNLKARNASIGAGNIHHPAMSIYNVLYNSKAETGATNLTGARFINTVKSFG
jgi:hypothetical protein